MRKINRPPLLRAHRWLKKAVRAFPRCREPVGLGANRVVTGNESLVADISQDCTYSSRISEHETATTHRRIDFGDLSCIGIRGRHSAPRGGEPGIEPGGR